MGPVLVVVGDVVDDEPFELLAVPDDGAGQPFGLLEEFSSDGSDPAFGEGVGHWGSRGRLEDLEAFGVEHLVEAVDELAAAVTYQSPCVFEAIGMGDEQVSGGSCYPGAGRVGGDTGEERLAGAVGVGPERPAVFGSVGFSGPPSEPDVRLSPHRALHEPVADPCLTARAVADCDPDTQCPSPGGRIAGIHQRLLAWGIKSAGSLGPFAMCRAFPGSHYYGSSAPS